MGSKVKKSLFILSILLLSSPVFGDKHKGETLYRWGECYDYKWMGFGKKEIHPVYKGQVKNGKPNGLGILITPWGRKYVGEWKDGRENGKGTFNYINGMKYVGEIKDGIWWNGTFYDQDGNITKKYVSGRLGVKE